LTLASAAARGFSCAGRLRRPSLVGGVSHQHVAAGRIPGDQIRSRPLSVHEERLSRPSELCLRRRRRHFSRDDPMRPEGCSITAVESARFDGGRYRADRRPQIGSWTGHHRLPSG
jgi:hypothetical protein